MNHFLILNVTVSLINKRLNDLVDNYKLRDAPRVKNPGGQVVMWHVVACRRRPAAPSDLPKSGGAAAPLAPPLGASLKDIVNRKQIGDWKKEI